MAAPTPEQASSFVQDAKLPDPSREGSPENLTQPSFDATKDQSVVVGSGVVSFKTGISENRRKAVTNSLLLAQLVLKKKGISPDDTQNWYHEYGSILANLGWLVETSEMSKDVSSQDDFDVHQAIMLVATALLGPGVAALAIVEATLKALSSMDTSTPWITLFNQQSRRSQAASFQIAQAEPTADGDMTVSLMAFAIDAKMDITQVLFFKVRRDLVSLQRLSTKAQIDVAVLDAVQNDLQQKVASFTSSFISQLPDLA